MDETGLLLDDLMRSKGTRCQTMRDGSVVCRVPDEANGSEDEYVCRLSDQNGRMHCTKLPDVPV